MNVQPINLCKDEGAYDDICQELFERLQAQGVILIVAAGNKGTGFSACMYGPLLPLIAKALRELAVQMEAQSNVAKLS